MHLNRVKIKNETLLSLVNFTNMKTFWALWTAKLFLWFTTLVVSNFNFWSVEIIGRLTRKSKSRLMTVHLSVHIIGLSPEDRTICLNDARNVWFVLFYTQVIIGIFIIFIFKVLGFSTPNFSVFFCRKLG